MKDNPTEKTRLFNFTQVSKENPSIQDQEPIDSEIVITIKKSSKEENTAKKLAIAIDEIQKKIDAQTTEDTEKIKLKKLNEHVSKIKDLYTEIDKKKKNIEESLKLDITKKISDEIYQYKSAIKNHYREIQEIASLAGIKPNGYLNHLWKGVKSSLWWVTLPGMGTNALSEFLEAYLHWGEGHNPSDTILNTSYQVTPFVFLHCFVTNAIATIALKKGKTWTEATKDFYDSGELTDCLKLSIKFYAASLGWTAGNKFFKTFGDSSLGKMLFGALGGGLGSGITLVLTATALTTFSKMKEKLANRFYGKTDKENTLGFIKELCEDVALFPNAFVEGIVFSLVSDLEIAKKMIAYFRIKDSDTLRQVILHGLGAGITGTIASLSFAFPGEVAPSMAEYLYDKSGIFSPHEKKVRDIITEHPEILRNRHPYKKI